MTSKFYYRMVLFGLLVAGLLGLASLPARGATASNGQPTGAPTVDPKGQQGCAVGTVVAGTSKVVNGDFSIPAGPGSGIDPAAGFTSELPNRGPDTYPDDFSGGGFSIITGDFSPADPNYIFGRVFSGDPQRDVAASDTYFYSNPNKDINGHDVYHPQSNPTKDYAVLWTQTDVSLTVGTTYNFFAYFDNLVDPSLGNYGADPKIELRVNGVSAGEPITVSKSPDEWVPVQFSFTLIGETQDVGTQSLVTLQIRDRANTIEGDDFAMTGINLKQCVSGLGVALSNRLSIDNGDGTYDIPFVVTLKNYGVDQLALSKLQVTANLASTFSAPKILSFQVRSIRSASLTVNPGFNGASDQELLSGDINTLQSQTTATIEFMVRIRPGTEEGSLGPFDFQIRATADAGTESTGTIEVTDVSVPGLDPDPNDDREVKDPSEDKPTPIYIAPFTDYLPLVRR